MLRAAAFVLFVASVQGYSLTTTRCAIVRSPRLASAPLAAAKAKAKGKGKGKAAKPPPSEGEGKGATAATALSIFPSGVQGSNDRLRRVGMQNR